jgi:parallel beta-helix repeat protein
MFSDNNYALFVQHGVFVQGPANGTTYDSDGIALNVTSDEPADFYMLSKSGRRHYIAFNTTNYLSNLYHKAGDYQFTIYANSSGESNATVDYSSNVTNPIEINACGFIGSSHTKYELVNNITGPYCMFIEEVENISFDLMGFEINAEDEALFIGLTEQVTIKNGTVSSETLPIYMEFVNNMIFKDLEIVSGFYGYVGEGYVDVLFENDEFKRLSPESYGPIYTLTSEGGYVHVKNSIMTIYEMIRESYIEYYPPVFYDVFENVTLQLPAGEEEFIISCHGAVLCNIDFIDTNYSSSYIEADGEEVRIVITEHSRLSINSVDQEGQGIPAALEIESLSPFEHNPTQRVLSSTESNGKGDVYLSNKLKVYEFGENNLDYEQSFPSYNITARSGTEISNQNITFTSPVVVNFTFTFPTAAAYTLVDSCMELESDTDYKLEQDIVADQDPCITAESISAVTLDIDGYNIDGNGGNPIFINGSSDIEILTGDLTNSSNGIYAINSSDVTFRDLHITESSTGILMEQSSESLISDNIIEENGIGINMISCQDITLMENNFINNTENVIVDPSEGIIFIKNVLQAANIGLKLIEIINSVFIGDIFLGNTESIIVNQSSNIDFIRTNISSNLTDLKTIDANVSLSNVLFDENKIYEVGDSAIFGFFPPACIFGEDISTGTICNGTVGLNLDIDLKVVNNTFCIIKSGAVINGDILVEGGNLQIQDGIINGDILNGTGASVSIKGKNTLIDGAVTLQDGNEIIIKDANVTGSISTENTDIVIIKDVYVGVNVASTNDGTVVIKNNIIQGNLEITNSTSCDEKSNTVQGTNSGCP